MSNQKDIDFLIAKGFSGSLTQMSYDYLLAETGLTGADRTHMFQKYLIDRGFTGEATSDLLQNAASFHGKGSVTGLHNDIGIFAMLPVPLLQMKLVSDLLLTHGTGVATFTRSTTGTFVDKDDGLVKTAAIDAARFEQNGVLIEGASTNLLLRSEEFDNAAWSKNDTSVSANATTAPDGTNTADKIIESATTAFHSIAQSVTLSGSTQHTFSFFAKAAENTTIAIQLSPNSGWVGTASPNAQLNLATNAVLSQSGGVDNISITPAAFGFSKITLTATTEAVPGATSVNIFNDSLTSFLGDGVSGYFLWGAQIEQLPFASSYIKTVASTVTKTDEDTDIDAANMPAPTADYTVSMEVDAIGFDSGLSQVLFNIAGETSRRVAWNTTTGAIEATHGAVTSVSTSTFVAGDRVKISFVVDATNQTLYINGIQEDQDAKGTVTGTATAINIGHQGGVNQAFSHIKPLRIHDVALIALQVADL